MFKNKIIFVALYIEIEGYTGISLLHVVTLFADKIHIMLLEKDYDLSFYHFITI